MHQTTCHRSYEVRMYLYFYLSCGEHGLAWTTGLTWTLTYALTSSEQQYYPIGNFIKAQN